MSSTTEKAFWFGLGALVAYAVFRPFQEALPSLPNPGGLGAKEQKALANEIHDLRDQIQWQYQGLITEQEQHFYQIQALLSLYYQLRFDAPLPPLHRWSISPDFANLIVAHTRERHPALILDAGGGVSTLIAAYCLKEQGFGRVVALNDDPSSASTLDEQIRLHGLEMYAQVFHAPLREVAMEDKSWLWYETDVLDDLSQIDFLIVGGPPQHNNPIDMIRYPALPLVYPLLSDNALILLNDSKRADERRILEAWLAEFSLSLLAEFDTEKGAVLLQKI